MALIAVLSLITGYVQAAANEAMTITQNGTAKAVIVIAADATEPERHAADELAGFLRQTTGAKFEIQAGAIGALGTLGDPRAIPIVETFSNDEPDDNIERAAERALKELRQQKQLVPDEIVRIRETVDEFRKETDKLKNDLDDFKKRLNAKEKPVEKKDKNTSQTGSEEQ